MQDTTARVLSCEPLAQELVRLILSAPEIAAQAKAGQFIHMLVPDSGHVLRRPISRAEGLSPEGISACLLCNMQICGITILTSPLGQCSPPDSILITSGAKRSQISDFGYAN